MTLVAVLGTLFIYSTAMFTLPFVAFFGVRHLMTNEFNAENFTTNCVSVLAAVVTVNIIIASYAYKALHEPDDPEESNDPDDASISRDNVRAKSD